MQQKTGEVLKTSILFDSIASSRRRLADTGRSTSESNQRPYSSSLPWPVSATIMDFHEMPRGPVVIRLQARIQDLRCGARLMAAYVGHWAIDARSSR